MLSAGFKTKIVQQRPPGRSVYLLWEKKEKKLTQRVSILIVEERILLPLRLPPPLILLPPLLLLLISLQGFTTTSRSFICYHPKMEGQCFILTSLIEEEPQIE